MYLYEEMDMNGVRNWEYERGDVMIESLLTTGNFADIYLATNNKTGSTVVAKTLKGLTIIMYNVYA